MSFNLYQTCVSVNVICQCLVPLLQHLAKVSPDVVKRWVNEAQEAVSSDNVMVQVTLDMWEVEKRINLYKNCAGMFCKFEIKTEIEIHMLSAYSTNTLCF